MSKVSSKKLASLAGEILADWESLKAKGWEDYSMCDFYSWRKINMLAASVLSQTETRPKKAKRKKAKRK